MTDLRKRIMEATFDLVEGVVIDRGALADLLIEVDKLLAAGRVVDTSDPYQREAWLGDSGEKFLIVPIGDTGPEETDQ